MKAYRFVLDNVEEVTTGMAHTVVVNSKYTQKVYVDNFPLIQKYDIFRNKLPKILYPAIDPKNFIQSADFNQPLSDLLSR